MIICLTHPLSTNGCERPIIIDDFYSILPVKITLLLLLLPEYYIWCHWSFRAIVITSTILRVCSQVNVFCTEDLFLSLCKVCLKYMK